MSTVVGVFDSRERASEAIQALQAEGFNEENLSIVARHEEGQGQGDQGGGMMENVSDGAAWGGGIGALGGILAGVGALAIPGIGPILAAGPIAAGLSGAVAGGVAGGLIDLGIPEQDGRGFEEDVKQGRLLAVVEAEDEEELGLAENLLREYGANKVQQYQ